MLIEADEIHVWASWRRSFIGLSDYVNALIEHGFVITGREEPEPLEEGV